MVAYARIYSIYSQANNSNSNTNNNADLARKLDRCKKKKQSEKATKRWDGEVSNDKANAHFCCLWVWQPAAAGRKELGGGEGSGTVAAPAALSRAWSHVYIQLEVVSSFAAAVFSLFFLLVFFLFFWSPLACLPPTAAAAEKWSSCRTRWVGTVQ